MMPAILVSTILGVIRSLEAFEIELLLGTPIGLQVFSTKIHELVTWEPPQFAPAMALSTIFLGLLLFMVANAAKIYRETQLCDGHRQKFQHSFDAARAMALSGISFGNGLCTARHCFADDLASRRHVHEAFRIFQHSGSVDAR